MSEVIRCAVITGASSGMGAACAREFSKAGYRVVIAGRNSDRAHEIAEEIHADAPVIGDVADVSYCKDLIDTAVKRHGRIDALINAAGMITRSAAVDTSDEQWKRVLDVNLGGVFYTSRAAVPIMKRQGKGAIVNFGSIWGDVASSGVAAYCASKGAVHNLTRAMALDHAKDGIRINAVAPGSVYTAMTETDRKEPVTPEFLNRLAQLVPSGRMADPAEIAHVALFLASDAASYMTGSIVTVDAGFTAR